MVVRSAKTGVCVAGNQKDSPGPLSVFRRMKPLDALNDRCDPVLLLADLSHMACGQSGVHSYAGLIRTGHTPPYHGY